MTLPGRNYASVGTSLTPLRSLCLICGPHDSICLLAAFSAGKQPNGRNKETKLECEV